MANYSYGRKPLPKVENGHKFKGDNFCMIRPNTKIFAENTGLQFDSCNLCNCTIPVDSTRKFSPNIQVDFCTNLRPELVGLGYEKCAENCRHVIDTDSVIIDGKALDQNYKYQDTIVR